MKVLITGGHFSPARAVIHALPSSVDIVYVGRKHGLENDTAISLEYTLLQQEGIPFREIQPGRFHRLLYRNTPVSLYKIFRGFSQAWNILHQERPDVILSFGGYVAFSICLVGFLKRIPIILHDQTFETGLTNQVLSHIATKVCISWHTSATYFQKNKVIVTGNPNLSEMFTYHRKRPAHADTLILVTGGNSGAHVLNVYIENNLQRILKEAIIVHQTGDAQQFKDYQRLIARKQTLPPKLQERYHIEKFFTPEILHQYEADADLVISRAGANTVGELFILHKPTLIMPIPYTQRDEQKKNAQFLVDAGLAVQLNQKTTSNEQFFQTVHDMIRHIDQYSIKKSYETDIAPHKKAAQTLAEITQHVARRT